MPRLPSKPKSEPPKSSARQFAERAGRRGETWAALFLGLRGYRILARRVKTPVGEIDIVAKRGGTTVFVEVKARSFSHQEAEALGAVNQKRILRAAQWWLSRHPREAAGDVRIDVIFLAPFSWPRHIVNAFGAG